MPWADLITPAQEAVYAALQPLAGDSLVPGLQVLTAAPEDLQPPYILVGEIKSENLDDREDEQLEQITVELIHVFRGGKRGPLIAMLGAARQMLHGQPLADIDAQFETPNLLTTEVGTRIATGDFVGRQQFQFQAFPI